MIDLHTHSKFSDGSDTPFELATKAHEIGISALALTDHDSTESHEEIKAATDHYGIELVPGVEVSLRDNEFPRVRSGEEEPRNVHVLAYFLPLEPEHPLQKLLASLRDDRDRRNQRLVTMLQEQGFEKLNIEYLTELSGSLYSIGRPHFARAMFELHPEIVGERTDAAWSAVFSDWLGTGGKAYIPKTSTSIEDFVNAAKDSDTVISIAHPLVNYLDDGPTSGIEETMPRVIRSLKDRGFKGVEAYYGGTSANIRALMVKLTRDAGMIPTGGSDYHGTYKTDVALGTGRTGDLNVPNEVLDEIKAAR